MVKMIVKNGECNSEAIGRPLEIMADLSHGTIEIIDRVTSDCPDEEFKRIMIKAFIDSIEGVFL